jgi:hypothetical protein
VLHLKWGGGVDIRKEEHNRSKAAAVCIIVFAFNVAFFVLVCAIDAALPSSDHSPQTVHNSSGG